MNKNCGAACSVGAITTATQPQRTAWPAAPQCAAQEHKITKFQKKKCGNASAFVVCCKQAESKGGRGQANEPDRAVTAVPNQRRNHGATTNDNRTAHTLAHLFNRLLVLFLLPQLVAFVFISLCLLARHPCDIGVGKKQTVSEKNARVERCTNRFSCLLWQKILKNWKKTRAQSTREWESDRK